MLPRLGGSSAEVALVSPPRFLLVGETPAVVIQFQLSERMPRNFVPQAVGQPDFEMQIEPSPFLMRNGTSAEPSLVFTPLNGFIGNVTINATISPSEPLAPTISHFPSEVLLNASLPGSPSYPMVINASSTTESGLYTISVNGTSGSLTHSAIATIGVTSLFVPANGAALLYKGHFAQVAYTGSSTVLNSTFIDLGYVKVGVTNLTIITDFGTYQHTKPNEYNNCAPSSQGICPTIHCFPGPCSIVTVSPFEQSTDSFSILIPANTKPGNYTVTAVISWVLNPGSIDQASAPNIVAHGFLTVYAKPPAEPSTLPPSQPSTSQGATNNIWDKFVRPLLPILGGVWLVSLAIVGVLMLNGRRLRKSKPDSVTLAPRH